MRSWIRRSISILSVVLLFLPLYNAEGKEEVPVLRVLQPVVSEGDTVQHAGSSLRIAGIAWAEGGIAQVTVNNGNGGVKVRRLAVEYCDTRLLI